MGGSIGNVLGEIAKPLQQVGGMLGDTAGKALGQTPLGGMLGDSPMGAMMPGEDPLTQGAMQSLPGGKMAKKGNELMGGSSLTRNLKRRMMG
jgi:hypothetical protein|tara:strand:- start:349 stop:624 length:276 start_codon:yes stop_codon:yes gene_type:complete